MITDAELVAETLRGGSASFGTLVERYQVKLLRFLLTRCATRSDAEDALQDTFISAFRYLESYDPRWQFSTWLYRIAMRNAARNTGPRAHAEFDVADDAPDLLQACIAAEETENLWLTARRLLPGDMYAALWLRYGEDMPVKEIARALGRPQAWTRVTLMRARRRLVRAMADDARQKESKAYG